MKKMFLVMALCVLAVATIAGCGRNGNPAQPVDTTVSALATATATPGLSLNVTIRKSDTFNVQRTPTSTNYYQIQISDCSTPVSTARVIVNGTLVPYVGKLNISGVYKLNVPSIPVNGSYTTYVMYKNMTITTTSVVPGGQVLSADGLQLSWQYSGNERALAVYNMGTGIRTYTAATANMPQSPFAIPAAQAYPSSGNYYVTARFTSNANYYGATQYIKNGKSIAEHYTTTYIDK